jgi:uncharacterized tellurite resistance protein B-like protein
MTLENLTRIELADRLLGDRIALRSALLSKFRGEDEAKIKAERSAIVQVRKNLYLLNTDEIEALIATQLKELESDNLNLII